MGFKHYWEKHGLCASYSGKIKYTDLIKSRNTVFGDKRFDELKYKISDLRNVDSLDASIEDLIRIAHYDYAASKSNKRIKFAIVTDNTEVEQLAHLYAAECETLQTWSVEIFNSMEKARQWLAEQLDQSPQDIACY